MFFANPVVAVNFTESNSVCGGDWIVSNSTTLLTIDSFGECLWAMYIILVTI